MKYYYFEIIFVIIFLFTFLGCKKEDENIDLRDKYAGQYIGIKIHYNLQQHIQDTSNVVIYLNKIDKDSLFLIELDLGINDLYYYELKNDSFFINGDNYHVPSLSYKNDSLFCRYQSSLAPIFSEYELIKSK